METVVRWSPWQDLEAVERPLRRMLDVLELATPSLPAADIYETEDEYVVELEAPGFDEKEIEVEISDHSLRVKGERKEAKRHEEKAYRVHERLERAFERRFELPVDADGKRISAIFDKGLLEIHAPKTTRTSLRRIELERRN